MFHCLLRQLVAPYLPIQLIKWHDIYHERLLRSSSRHGMAPQQQSRVVKVPRSALYRVRGLIPTKSMFSRVWLFYYFRKVPCVAFFFVFKLFNLNRIPMIQGARLGGDFVVTISRNNGSNCLALAKLLLLLGRDAISRKSGELNKVNSLLIFPNESVLLADTKFFTTSAIFS